tara:strand:+ start:120 stop:548 length:429 start_codon:yes stop_codon:yes gene_type:complete
MLTALKYALFAVVATFFNLMIQRLILFHGDSAVYFLFAVTCGTISGLVIKYFLDKRWIFHNRINDIGYHARTFPLYVVMGIFTTALFWLFETIFWLTWRTHSMREVGAVIGLIAGYCLKYYLDRKFVFHQNSAVRKSKKIQN